MRLSDKVAIVTGARGGIGRGIADCLSAEGAFTYVTDVAEPLEPLGERQEFAELDVAEPDAWERVVATALDAHGHVDVLVNNAALINYQAIDEVVLEDWNRSLAVNQTGVMLGMRAVIPSMKRQGGGSIINLASSWAIVAAPGVAAYHATKGAVRMMTKNAAMTYAGDGIRVNSIVPGIVKTPLTDKQPDVTAGVVADTPLGLADPKEIGHGAVFLASDESSQVTGADFMMDGGYTVH